MGLADDIRRVAVGLEGAESLLRSIGSAVGGRYCSEAASAIADARAALDGLADGADDLAEERDTLQNALDQADADLSDLRESFGETVAACADDPTAAKSVDAQLRVGVDPTEVAL